MGNNEQRRHVVLLLIVIFITLCLLPARKFFIPHFIGATVTQLYVRGNSPPLLNPIGNQTIYTNQTWHFLVNATDPEHDAILYWANTSLFAVGTDGWIHYHPPVAAIGIYSINFTVSDTFNASSEETVQLSILGSCTDLTCDNNENCHSCPADCGACPITGAGTGGTGQTFRDIDSGGGGGAAGKPCEEKWACSEWAVCKGGKQTRTCTDANKCRTTKNKPNETRACVYKTACYDGVMNNGETGIDCGGACLPCSSCNDSIKNCHDGACEEDIDCGGPCGACEAFYVKPPFFEKPIRISKQFPWLILLIILLILTFTTVSDRVYVKHISKKEFEDYKKRIKKYQTLRVKLKPFVIDTLAISLVISLYIFWFSNSEADMRKYIWVPAMLILAIPAAVAIVLRRREYSEYSKQRKEHMLRITHEQELWHIVRVEERMLLSLAETIEHRIYSLVMAHEFKGSPELYKQMERIYSQLSELSKQHAVLAVSILPDEAVQKSIRSLAKNSALKQAGKDEPVFLSIQANLQILDEAYRKNDQPVYFEKDLKEQILAVSKSAVAMSYIKADQQLVSAYNELVDIYGYLKKRLTLLEEHEKSESEHENRLISEIDQLKANDALMAIINSNEKLSLLPSQLDQLVQHYKKEQDLYESLKTANESADKVKAEKIAKVKKALSWLPFFPKKEGEQ